MREQFLVAREELGDNEVVLLKLMTELQFNSYPDPEREIGTSVMVKCFKDGKVHIGFLIEAVRFKNASLFDTYLHWAAGVLQSRNIPIADLVNNLHFMESACQQLLSYDSYRIVSNFIQGGIETLKNVQPLPETYLLSTNPLQGEAKGYLSYLLKADRKNARTIINDLLKNGHSISDIYEHIFQTTQYEIGLLWQTNRISVAHEHYCTAATQSIIAGFYKELFGGERIGKKIIGCAVSGELHEFGIRMLTDFFELAGWDTYYLGANMRDENLVTAACEQGADVLAISVTWPLNLGRVETLIGKIRSNPQLNSMKILVGGYAFNTPSDLWRNTGADGSSGNARQAVALAETLIKE